MSSIDLDKNAILCLQGIAWLKTFYFSVLWYMPHPLGHADGDSLALNNRKFHWGIDPNVKIKIYIAWYTPPYPIGVGNSVVTNDLSIIRIGCFLCLDQIS